MSDARPHPRGRSARRLPERARGHPDRRQGRADRRARAHRPVAARGDVVRAGRRHPAARRRRGGARSASTSRTASRVTVLIPNERGLDNALALRERFDEVNCFLSASETHNRKNVNRSVEESLTGLERVIGRARRRGAARRGRHLASRSAARTRAPVPRERVWSIARAARRRGRVGDRVRRHDRDGEPGAGAVVLRGGARGARRRRRAHRALPQHARPGAGERLRGAGGRLPRRSSRRSASSAAAPSPRARPATSPPRTSSRCSTRWASRPGSTSTRSSPPPRRAPGAPRPPARLAHARRRPDRLARPPLMRDPVLIANRGEIAVRVARTVHALGPALRRGVHRRRRRRRRTSTRPTSRCASRPTSTPTRCSRPRVPCGARRRSTPATAS